MRFYTFILLLFGSLLCAQSGLDLNLEQDTLTTAYKESVRDFIFSINGGERGSVMPTHYTGIDFKLSDNIDGGDIPLAIKTGQYLFFKNLSNAACSDCHSPLQSGFAGLKRGIGFGGEGLGVLRFITPNAARVDTQSVVTPTVFNSLYLERALHDKSMGYVGENTTLPDSILEKRVPNLFGITGIQVQGIAGIGVHETASIDSIKQDSVLMQALSILYDGAKVDLTMVGQLLALYEQTLLTCNAPYQKGLKDVNDLDDDGWRGSLLFFDKAACNSCHNGQALMSDNLAFTTAKNLYKGTQGRKGFTGKSDEAYDVAVTTPYNVAGKEGKLFYGTNGDFTNLAVFIKKHQKVHRLPPLTNKEQKLLMYFLENSLIDPTMDRIFTPISQEQLKQFLK